METKARGKGLGRENHLGLCQSCEGDRDAQRCPWFWIPALAVDFFDAGCFHGRNNWNMYIIKSSSLQPFQYDVLGFLASDGGLTFRSLQ